MIKFMNHITKYWRRYLLVILFFPFILNFLVNCRVCIWEDYIVGEPKDWLSFWASYIGGAGSIIMLFIALKTLSTHKEDNRPYIYTRIIKHSGKLYLECTNVGKTVAPEIELMIDKKLIKDIKIDKKLIDDKTLEAFKDHFLALNKLKFTLPVNGKKEIFLCYGELSLTSLKMYSRCVGHAINFENKTVRFDNIDIQMDELNICYSEIAKEIKSIKIPYSDYEQLEQFELSLAEDKEQDTLGIIASQVAKIADELEKNNTNKYGTNNKRASK